MVIAASTQVHIQRESRIIPSQVGVSSWSVGNDYLFHMLGTFRHAGTAEGTLLLLVVLHIILP